MAGKENLVSLKDRTTEEQREIARKGGIASGKVRKEKKLLSMALKECLTDDVKLQINTALLQQAKDGNVKAFEVIRDTIGESPVLKQAMTNSQGDDIPQINRDIPKE